MASGEAGFVDIELAALVVGVNSSLPVMLLVVAEVKVEVDNIAVVIVAIAVLGSVSVVDDNSLLPSSGHTPKTHGSIEQQPWKASPVQTYHCELGGHIVP
jgi:ABC-type enterobactin transport system permease subunit